MYWSMVCLHFFLQIRNNTNIVHPGYKQYRLITAMHLLLSSVMHTVELVETKETKERDYQGYWENKTKQKQAY